MSYDVATKLENQNEIMELLQEGFCNSNQMLEQDAAYACLMQDLDNAIIQMQLNYLEGRI